MKESEKWLEGSLAAKVVHLAAERDILMRHVESALAIAEDSDDEDLRDWAKTVLEQVPITKRSR